MDDHVLEDTLPCAMVGEPALCAWEPLVLERPLGLEGEDERDDSLGLAWMKKITACGIRGIYHVSCVKKMCVT